MSKIHQAFVLENKVEKICEAMFIPAQTVDYCPQSAGYGLFFICRLMADIIHCHR